MGNNEKRTNEEHNTVQVQYTTSYLMMSKNDYTYCYCQCNFSTNLFVVQIFKHNNRKYQ